MGDRKLHVSLVITTLLLYVDVVGLQLGALACALCTCAGQSSTPRARGLHSYPAALRLL